MNAQIQQVECSACSQKNRIRVAGERGKFKCGRCGSELIFDALIESWQDEVVKLYPAIGVSGSPENKAFVEAYKEAGQTPDGIALAHIVMGAIAQDRSSMRCAPRIMKESDFPLMDVVTSDGRLLTVLTRIIEQRTTVVPIQSEGQGFQIRYSTYDPEILGELHHFWVKGIEDPDGFTTIGATLMLGSFEFPDEFKQLQKHVSGSTANISELACLETDSSMFPEAGFPMKDIVRVSEGEISVTTDIGFFGISKKPRTSVSPVGFSKFGWKLGFQAVYCTSDIMALLELHNLWRRMVQFEDFEMLVSNAKNGRVEFYPNDEHLKKYIIGFHA